MDRRLFLQSLAAVTLGGATTLTSAAELKQSMVSVDSEGNPFNLDSYAGKICLVSFFTASCALCSHDLGQMREFYGSNRKKNFSLIGVNLDAKKEDFIDYANFFKQAVPKDQRFPLIWRNDPKHADTFGPIVKQPTHFILDGKQEQVFKREGSFQPGDWDQLWTKLG
jgi:peroxiredoxin